MDISIEPQTQWWCLKAGRGGVLEDDWLDRGFVSTGWGIDGPDPRAVSGSDFRSNDPSNLQLSKFVGHHDSGMEDGDVVIAYAPEKGHITGVGTVSELRYDEDMTFRYLTEEEAKEAQVDDHYYIRPVSWFDWGTPVQVTDLSKRFQVNGSDQIPTPGTLNRYGTLETHTDRLETLAEEINQAETVESSMDGFGPEQESQIQEWVVTNISSLGVKNPRREVRTAAGRIDVLADSEDGETVIEIKHGRAGDRALGQLLGYIGARSEENPEPISGILLADSFTPRVKHAETILDDVTLYEFEVETRLQEI